jgi:hypothetical protein
MAIEVGGRKATLDPPCQNSYSLWAWLANLGCKGVEVFILGCKAGFWSCGTGEGEGGKGTNAADMENCQTCHGTLWRGRRNTFTNGVK